MSADTCSVIRKILKKHFINDDVLYHLSHLFSSMYFRTICSECNKSNKDMTFL